MADEKFDVFTHSFVPKHEKIEQDEIEPILKRYNITKKQLPKIYKNDAVIKALGNIEVGDVIKIIRQSPTMGEVEFFRVVVHG
ncbi:MAG: DNA-directed RNA polymerase subunit H [archaeon]